MAHQLTAFFMAMAALISMTQARVTWAFLLQ